VLQYRLKTEYGADSRLEPASWKIIRWAAPESAGELTEEILPSGSRLAVDDRQQTVVLFPEEWACNFFEERNPKIKLTTLPNQTGENAPAVNSRH